MGKLYLKTLQTTICIGDEVHQEMLMKQDLPVVLGEEYNDIHHLLEREFNDIHQNSLKMIDRISDEKIKAFFRENLKIEVEKYRSCEYREDRITFLPYIDDVPDQILNDFYSSLEKFLERGV